MQDSAEASYPADESDLTNCFSNDTDGIKQLLTWLAKQGGQGCPLGLEATGGLELELCFWPILEQSIRYVVIFQVNYLVDTRGKVIKRAIRYVW